MRPLPIGERNRQGSVDGGEWDHLRATWRKIERMWRSALDAANNLGRSSSSCSNSSGGGGGGGGTRYTGSCGRRPGEGGGGGGNDMRTSSSSSGRVAGIENGVDMVEKVKVGDGSSAGAESAVSAIADTVVAVAATGGLMAEDSKHPGVIHLGEASLALTVAGRVNKVAPSSTVPGSSISGDSSTVAENNASAVPADATTTGTTPAPATCGHRAGMDVSPDAIGSCLDAGVGDGVSGSSSAPARAACAITAAAVHGLPLAAATTASPHEASAAAPLSPTAININSPALNSSTVGNIGASRREPVKTAREREAKEDASIGQPQTKRSKTDNGDGNNNSSGKSNNAHPPTADADATTSLSGAASESMPNRTRPLKAVESGAATLAAESAEGKVEINNVGEGRAGGREDATTTTVAGDSASRDVAGLCGPASGAAASTSGSSTNKNDSVVTAKVAAASTVATTPRSTEMDESSTTTTTPPAETLRVVSGGKARAVVPSSTAGPVGASPTKARDNPSAITSAPGAGATAGAVTATTATGVVPPPLLSAQSSDCKTSSSNSKAPYSNGSRSAAGGGSAGVVTKRRMARGGEGGGSESGETTHGNSLGAPEEMVALRGTVFLEPNFNKVDFFSHREKKAQQLRNTAKV